MLRFTNSPPSTAKTLTQCELGPEQRASWLAADYCTARFRRRTRSRPSGLTWPSSGVAACRNRTGASPRQGGSAGAAGGDQGRRRRAQGAAL